MKNNIVVLDTETHTLKGAVIQLAYAHLEFHDREQKIAQSVLDVNQTEQKSAQNALEFIAPIDTSKKIIEPCLDHAGLFTGMYSIGDLKIDPAAMAVHNILDSDLLGKPHYSTIELPFYSDGYIIGHNIDYDIACLELSLSRKLDVKRICTLALAREIWPQFSSHKLGALIYNIYGPTDYARNLVSSSHDAAVDIRNTAHVLSAICAHLRITNIEALYEASQAARLPKVMPFGKHKGKFLKDLPPAYLKWYLTTDRQDPYLSEAINNCLGIKNDQ